MKAININVFVFYIILYKYHNQNNKMNSRDDKRYIPIIYY